MKKIVLLLFLTSLCCLSYGQDTSLFSDHHRLSTPDSMIFEPIFVRRVDTMFSIARYCYCNPIRYVFLDTIIWNSRCGWHRCKEDNVYTVYTFKKTKEFDHIVNGHVYKPRKIVSYKGTKKISSSFFMGEMCFHRKYD